MGWLFQTDLALHFLSLNMWLWINNLIKQSDSLKIRSGCGFLIYSAWKRWMQFVWKCNLTLQSTSLDQNDTSRNGSVKNIWPWKLAHTHGTHMVSPQYVFICDVSRQFSAETVCHKRNGHNINYVWHHGHVANWKLKCKNSNVHVTILRKFKSG